jgi:HEAT repeat protein
MTSCISRLPAFAVLFISMNVLSYLQAQTTAPSVQNFYQTLPNEAKKRALPQAEIERYANLAASLPTLELGRLLPTIVNDLSARDRDARSDALLALFSIGQRPDGAELLRTHVGEIGQILNDEDPVLSSATATFFASIHPMPPREVVIPLLRFVERRDADRQAQAAALYPLIRVAPEDTNVIEAVVSWFALPLDSSTRNRALNAIGDRKVTSSQLQNIALGALGDSDPSIRFSAIQCVSRMGGNALEKARPILIKMSTSQTEPELIKRAAQDASRGSQ